MPIPSASAKTSGTCTALMTSSNRSIGFESPAVANATASIPLQIIGTSEKLRRTR